MDVIDDTNIKYNVIYINCQFEIALSLRKPRRMLHSLLVIQKTFRFIIISITVRISSSGGTLLYALQVC